MKLNFIGLAFFYQSSGATFPSIVSLALLNGHGSDEAMAASKCKPTARTQPKPWYHRGRCEISNLHGSHVPQPQGAVIGKGYDKVCNNCHFLLSMHGDGYCQSPLRIYQGIMNKLIILGLGLGLGFLFSNLLSLFIN